MAVFCIVLVLVLLVSVLYTLLLRRQIRKVRKQLDERVRSGSMHLLSVQLLDKQLSGLTGSINDMLIFSQGILNERQRSEQVVKEMLAGVSHDLRTPLTAIRGNAQLLAESGLAAEQKRICETIQRQTDSMQQLAEHFWEYAYHAANDIEPLQEKVNITNLAADSIAALVPALESNGLRVDFSQAKPLNVRADKELCERIILNLIRNCIAYATGTIKVSIHADHAFVVLSFTNPLCAGTKIDVARLFEKFYSAEQSRTRAAGFGLYLVRMFAEKMGGGVAAGIQDSNLTVQVRLLRF